MFRYCQYVENFLRDFFNSLFSYLDDNKFLSGHQSVIHSNDSCENQLLAIVHETYTAFDANQTLETRGVYLDMSNAFDNVWCAGLIYKITSVGSLGNFLKVIKTFLNNKF